MDLTEDLVDDVVAGEFVVPHVLLAGGGVDEAVLRALAAHVAPVVVLSCLEVLRRQPRRISEKFCREENSPIQPSSKQLLNTTLVKT